MVTPLSSTYAEARARFLAAAAVADAAVESFDHPLTGPDGETLAVDVARLGGADLDDIVLVVSGTHGVEGYCGSALQSEWLETAAASRPGGVGVVMIHALNPYGFAWVRRVNEDNVDLNRNFVDWSAPLPANVDYDAIAVIVVPEAWDATTQQHTTLALLELVAERGLPTVQAIVSRGQYSNPTGLFYGGTGPTWSNRWLREWGAANLAATRRLAIVDLHTGLGPSGHGELIISEPASSAAYRRAAEWWGDVYSMTDGQSVSAVLSGDWLAVGGELAPAATVTATALEFGTVDPVTVMQALRADAWLHAHGDPVGLESVAIRDQVRAAFIDDGPIWAGAVWQRYAEVMSAALAHVGN